MTELTTAIAAAIPTIPFEWLRARRWFSSKGQTLDQISLIDWGALPTDEPGILALADVRYQSGRSEQYVLPLIATHADRSDPGRPPPAFSLQHDGATWQVQDAFQFPSFQRLLMAQMINGGTLATERGRAVWQPEAALRQAPPPLDQIKLVTAEQSNTSIIYDRQVILKGFRRVVAGVNPDVEVSRFLSRAGFRNTPAMLGSISYVDRNNVEHSLGVAQAFAPNEGDAWEHTLHLLDQFVADLPQADQNDAIADETRQRAADQMAELRQLGVLTGEMHVALASDPHDPDFAPQPLTTDQIDQWQRAMRAQAETIMPLLQTKLASLPPDQQRAVTQLIEGRARIEEQIGSLDQLAHADVTITRFHGDYHLGQVLVSEGGWLILDFEGEPLRSLAERRARSSPLKDVAGMLRSFSYAAQTALRNALDQQRVAPWTSAWERAARQAFIDGYSAATRGASFVPSDPALMRAALAVFELEKALYELNYEINNRPDWLPIPLRGIQRIIGE